MEENKNYSVSDDDDFGGDLDIDTVSDDEYLDVFNDEEPDSSNDEPDDNFDDDLIDNTDDDIDSEKEDKKKKDKKDALRKEKEAQDEYERQAMLDEDAELRKQSGISEDKPVENIDNRNIAHVTEAEHGTTIDDDFISQLANGPTYDEEQSAIIAESNRVIANNEALSDTLAAQRENNGEYGYGVLEAGGEASAISSLNQDKGSNNTEHTTQDSGTENMPNEVYEKNGTQEPETVNVTDSIREESVLQYSDIVTDEQNTEYSKTDMQTNDTQSDNDIHYGYGTLKSDNIEPNYAEKQNIGSNYTADTAPNYATNDTSRADIAYEADYTKNDAPEYNSQNVTKADTDDNAGSIIDIIADASAKENVQVVEVKEDKIPDNIITESEQERNNYVSVDGVDKVLASTANNPEKNDNTQVEKSRTVDTKTADETPDINIIDKLTGDNIATPEEADNSKKAIIADDVVHVFREAVAGMNIDNNAVKVSDMYISENGSYENDAIKDTSNYSARIGEDATESNNIEDKSNTDTISKILSDTNATVDFVTRDGAIIENTSVINSELLQGNVAVLAERLKSVASEAEKIAINTKIEAINTDVNNLENKRTEFATNTTSAVSEIASVTGMSIDDIKKCVTNNDTDILLSNGIKSGTVDEIKAHYTNIKSIDKAIAELKSDGAVKNETKERISAMGISLNTSDGELANKLKEKEIKSASVDDTHKETETRKEQKSHFKEDALHTFAIGLNVTAVRLQQAGQIMVDKTKDDILYGDRYMRTGRDEIKKYTQPMATVATMIGLTGLASDTKHQVANISNAGAKAAKAITDGKMDVLDLNLSRKELKEKLKSAGVSRDAISQITKNKTDIQLMLRVKANLLDKQGRGLVGLSDADKKLLSGNDFFNLKNKEVGDLLKRHLAGSDNDVVRYMVTNGRLNSKDIRNLVKKKNIEKNGINSDDVALLKLIGKTQRMRGAKIELDKRRIQLIQQRVKKSAMEIMKGDKNTEAGVKNLQMAYKTTRLVSHAVPYDLTKKILLGTKRGGYKGVISIAAKTLAKGGKFSAKILSKHANKLAVQFAKNTAVGRTLAKGVATVKQGADAAKSAVKTGAKVVAAPVTNSVNAAKKAYKEAARKAREVAKKAAQTKAGKVAAATAKAGGKGVSLFVGKPLKAGAGVARKISASIGKIISVWNKIKKFLLIGALCIVASYMMTVLFVNMILTIFNQDGETIQTVLLADSDNFVEEQIQRISDKFATRKEDAISTGEGTPINPNVVNGHTISKYGHPDSTGNWVKGYKIYYTDSDGNVIQDGQNNVKDTLILTYVQMDGEWGINQEDGDPTGDSFENKAIKMMDKWYDWLNDSGKNNVEESDIYFCDDGCDTIYYTCNDDAIADNDDHDYVSMSVAQSEINAGAHVYPAGKTLSKKNYGDYYIATCNGHDHGKEETEIVGPKGCDDYEVTFDEDKHTGVAYYTAKCNGHTNDKGVRTRHVDYKGVISRPEKCDYYNLTEEDGKIIATCNKEGGRSHDHGTKRGTGVDTFIGCTDYSVQYYCTGHSATMCYGHKDVTIKIPVKVMQDAFDAKKKVSGDGLYSYLPIDKPWSEDDKEWCFDLYNADWYDLYGIDPMGGVGFTVDGTFDEGEIADIVASIGSTSTVRQNIIKSALSQVGSLPYYFGGKPRSGSVPIITNVGYAGAEAQRPDTDDNRTIAGLDCFGFCQWSYWNATGQNILPEGTNATTTMVYNLDSYGNLVNIPKSELQPGDLGFMRGHTGIYAGNVNGVDMWIHCNAGSNTVSYQAYNGFTRYYRLNGLE